MNGFTDDKEALEVQKLFEELAEKPASLFTVNDILHLANRQPTWYGPIGSFSAKDLRILKGMELRVKEREARGC